jgi:hypothetical protein
MRLWIKAPARYLFRGSLFLKTSWNQVHHAPEPSSSQMKNALQNGFSREKACLSKDPPEAISFVI